jgi:glucose-1-phosphate thymidylyltransferase
MKIIIPMAGMGKRMRPHTLSVPKPLIPIAGKPIVHRLVEDIARVCQSQVAEVAFIIKEAFGPKVEAELLAIAAQVGAQGSIHYQEEALGTAHAVMCAASALEGPVVVAFADTLFKADFVLDTSQESIIWVQKVEDPRPFGVVKLDAEGYINEFVEKPQHFVSDLAIIGIYYFKDGAYLKSELQYLLDHDIKDKGEYQLTNALENMKNKGTKFVAGQVSEWLDCGNKDATVYTNQRYLEFIKEQDLVSKHAQITDTVLIPPVFIAEGVVLEQCVIGPHVSIGKNTEIRQSILRNSIVQEGSQLQKVHCENSMIGNFVSLEGEAADLSLGDYNSLKLF